MGNYRELFISQFLDYYHYAAVIYDEDTKCFYNALFEGTSYGGGSLKRRSTPISIDAVRKLAKASEDRNAEKYVEFKAEEKE